MTGQEVFAKACGLLHFFYFFFLTPAAFSWRVMRHLGGERKFSKTTASVS